jgi:hypothetical protein
VDVKFPIKCSTKYALGKILIILSFWFFYRGQIRSGGFFDVRKKTTGFLTYHGFVTIASSSRIISLLLLLYID